MTVADRRNTAATGAAEGSIAARLDALLASAPDLATFTALQRRGIDSRFLYFPDENHWISKPANSLQWHAEVLGWLDRHPK